MAIRTQQTIAKPDNVSQLTPASRGGLSDFRQLAAKTWIPVLLAAATFWVYWPSLKSDFVYDARIEILQEGFLTSLSNLPAVLSLKVLGMNTLLGRRPGHLLFLMLLATVCGKTPFGYHLACNLLHAANIALLFVFLRRLVTTELKDLAGTDEWKVQLALVTVVLIFALHPLATETVAGVSFSSDLLVAFFTLLALLAATAFRPENRTAALSIGAGGALCAFAAVTCKESGLAAALLLIVYWALFRRHDAKGPWLSFLIAATVLTVAFLALRFRFNPTGEISEHYLGGSFSQVLWIQPRLWAFMMGKLIWPVGLSADYTMSDVNGISSPLALVIITLVVVFQLWLAFRSRIGALGVACYWLGLVTVSNFIPLYRILADRFYYLPLAGVAMQLLALLLMTLPSRAGFWMALTPLFLAILPLTFLTLTREAVFADEFSLWNDTRQASPFSSLAHYDLGNVLLDKGQLDEARLEFQKALEIDPAYAKAHNNLGNVLLREGQTDKAITEYRRTLALNPYIAETHNNLGDVLLQKGRIDEAMTEFQQAIALKPDFAVAHYDFGIALLQKGNIDAAIDEYKQALRIDPGDAKTHYNLGNALLQKGQKADAMAQYQKTIEIEPGHVPARYNFGLLLMQTGRLDEAMVQFQKVLEIDPDNPEAHSNFGNTLLQKGHVDEAMTQYQRALDINPNYADAHYNFGLALFQKGRLDDAIDQFKVALRLNPNDIDSKNNLAKLQTLARKESLH